jgi:molecular chaperone GrpE
MPEKFKKETKKKRKLKSEKSTTSKPSVKENEVILSLENQVSEINDKHLRLKAEFDNFRRRKINELSSLLKYDGENVIKGFLPILDDLHRMIESSNASEKSLLDGIKMVESKIENFLDSLDVKPFGERGDTMNAELHDAMITQTDDKLDDNSIISVFENGYTYREKVIRHAKVIVNKK